MCSQSVYPAGRVLTRADTANGKHSNSSVQVRIQFKDLPGNLYAGAGSQRNELVMRIQPEEAVYIKVSPYKHCVRVRRGCLLPCTMLRAFPLALR